MMVTGLVQCGVAAIALGARSLAGGWFFVVSVVAFGIVPAVILGPLVALGFFAPPEALPLLVIADICLLTAALTLPDVGDNPGYEFPWMKLRRGIAHLPTDSPKAGRLVSIGRTSGYGYLASLVLLTAWTLL